MQYSATIYRLLSHLKMYMYNLPQITHHNPHRRSSLLVSAIPLSIPHIYALAHHLQLRLLAHSPNL